MRAAADRCAATAIRTSARATPRTIRSAAAALAEFALEARIRFGNFGVVPFFDGGNLYDARACRISAHLAYGTGLGVRYYTSFGPIRVDVGTPLNRQKGDSRVAVYVSLGQAF